MATTLMTIGASEMTGEIPVSFKKSYDLVPDLGLASSGGEGNPWFVEAKIQFAIFSITTSTSAGLETGCVNTPTSKGKKKWSLVFLSVRPSRATPPRRRPGS